MFINKIIDKIGVYNKNCSPEEYADLMRWIIKNKPTNSLVQLVFLMINQHIITMQFAAVNIVI